MHLPPFLFSSWLFNPPLINYAKYVTGIFNMYMMLYICIFHIKLWMILRKTAIARMRLSYISAKIILILYNINIYTNASTKINLDRNERRRSIFVTSSSECLSTPDDYLENLESCRVWNARIAERLLFRHAFSETYTYFPTVFPSQPQLIGGCR